MRFADVIGNQNVASSLRQMVDSGRVPHAILFYENDGSGALALALAFIRYLNCHHKVDGEACGECPSCRQMDKLIHPDLHFIFPVNKGPKTTDDKPTSESYLKYWRELASADPYFTEADLQRAIGIETKNGLIAVAEAKSLITKLSLASVSDGYKAVIFYLPEKMNADTANRLLKLVEEPPEKTLFLFITHSPENVLQTIFSRCQSVRVVPLSKEEIAQVKALKPEAEDAQENVFMDLFADLMTALTSRDLIGALDIVENISVGESREKQKAFCIFASDCLRKIFLVQQKVESVADIQDVYVDFYRKMASLCESSFCGRAFSDLTNAVSLIDRNVNSRIIFTDLVNRMFMSIK